MKKISPENLLQFYYCEMPADQRNNIKQALADNWPLAEKMKVLLEATHLLDRGIAAPREEAISFIVKYAGAHSSAVI